MSKQPVAVNLRLYSRKGCHLCDDMLDALMSMQDVFRIAVHIVDIDTDPVLQSQYALRIPVLTSGNGDTVICEQTLDRQAIFDYLDLPGQHPVTDA